MSESSSVYSQNSVTAQLRLFFDLYFVVSVFCICDLSLIVLFCLCAFIQFTRLHVRVLRTITLYVIDVFLGQMLAGWDVLLRCPYY